MHLPFSKKLLSVKFSHGAINLYVRAKTANHIDSVFSQLLSSGDL